MDSILFSAWQNKEPPFDGLTLTVKQAVPLETLANVLAAVVGKLHKSFGGEPLHFVMDWHEHDGVVLPATPTSWEVLQSEVVTAAQISGLFCNGDTFVRRGFYPQSRQFYLRFYVNEPGYAGPVEEDDGDFDLTIAKEVVSNLASRVAPNMVYILREMLGSNLQIIPAYDFFNDREAPHYIG